MKIEMKTIVAVLLILMICFCIIGIMALPVYAQQPRSTPTLAPTMDPSETVIPYPSPEPTPGFSVYLPLIHNSGGESELLRKGKKPPKKIDSNCVLEPDSLWWKTLQLRLGQVYFYTVGKITIYCYGYPPIPFYKGQTAPIISCISTDPINEAACNEGRTP